jgi:hypothetical protein
MTRSRFVLQLGHGLTKQNPERGIETARLYRNAFPKMWLDKTESRAGRVGHGERGSDQDPIRIRSNRIADPIERNITGSRTDDGGENRITVDRRGAAGQGRLGATSTLRI